MVERGRYRCTVPRPRPPRSRSASAGGTAATIPAANPSWPISSSNRYPPARARTSAASAELPLRVGSTASSTSRRRQRSASRPMITVATTVPSSSPKPTRVEPDPHQPRITMRSPSCRNPRVSPFGRSSGCTPRAVSSMKLPPSVRGSAPESVPDANTSPVRSDAPFEVSVRDLLRGRPVERVGHLDLRHGERRLTRGTHRGRLEPRLRGAVRESKGARSAGARRASDPHGRQSLDERGRERVEGNQP